MSDIPATALRITLSDQAASFLDTATPEVRRHLVEMIREKSVHPEFQMCVISWTMDGKWPHVERAMKSYLHRPGLRILFHCTVNPKGIHVDKIDWRSNNPYGDGN